MIAAQIRRLEVERDPRSLKSLMELMPRKILADRSENILLLINCCFPVYLQWFFSHRSVSFAPTVCRVGEKISPQAIFRKNFVSHNIL
jgi:hypothetical protein